MISLTLVGRFGFIVHSGPITPVLGIQLESHMLVLSPSPIRFINPCLSASRPSQIALQVFDGLLPSAALKDHLTGNKLN